MADSNTALRAGALRGVAETAKAHADEAAVARERVFEVSDLSVSYSGAVALRGVSLCIESRSVTGFIGPSGCG